MSEAASTHTTEKAASSSFRKRLLASRLGRGDLGFMPVLVALVVIAIVFEASNATFLTPRNLSNLTLQLGVLGITVVAVAQWVVTPLGATRNSYVAPGRPRKSSERTVVERRSIRQLDRGALVRRT